MEKSFIMDLTVKTEKHWRKIVINNLEVETVQESTVKNCDQSHDRVRGTRLNNEDFNNLTLIDPPFYSLRGDSICSYTVTGMKTRPPKNSIFDKE